VIKKGLQWEVVQDKKKDVDEEVAMFMTQQDIRSFSSQMFCGKFYLYKRKMYDFFSIFQVVPLPHFNNSLQ